MSNLGAASAVGARQSVKQIDAPPVVLEDLDDNWQAEPGSFGARGHIGFDQPMPVFVGKSFAIVADSDSDVARTSAPSVTTTLPLSLAFFKASIPSVAFFKDVCDCLRNEPAIEIRKHGLVRQLLLEINVPTPDPHQEDRLTDAIGQIVAGRASFRHLRKRRKFVDHPFDVVDLADNRVGALVEYVLALDEWRP